MSAPRSGAERELAEVVRHLRDAVVGLGADGAVLSWNPGAERLYATPAGEAMGRSFARFVPEAGLGAFEARLEDALSGRDVPVTQVVRQRPDGRDVDVEECLFAVRDDAPGVAARVVCVGRDMSEVTRWRRAAAFLSAPSLSARHAVERARAPAMQEALHAADRAAAEGGAPVLLLGEMGVGKSWLARRIHQASSRAEAPFFEINCAGLGGELLEAELFGHERGGFADGVVTARRGLVETADGGTLFLDEVGELSMAVQGQLLTFLDTHEFRRLGGQRSLRADVRLVVASHFDLRVAVDRERFRRDLHQRVSGLTIMVPPLRERRDEIAVLARTILADMARRAGRPAVGLGRGVTAALERYPWPGNIRELGNAIERALIVGRGERVELAHLPPELHEPDLPPPPPSARSLDARARQHIVDALRETNGNRTRAARLLGISRSTLKRKLADMKSRQK